MTARRARLRVYVTPKSAREGIAGWREGELWVKVTAPPEDGKANSAVCELLGDRLGVPKSAVRVVRGETARHKLVEFDGVDARALTRVFGRPPG